MKKPIVFILIIISACVSFNNSTLPKKKLITCGWAFVYFTKEDNTYCPVTEKNISRDNVVEKAQFYLYPVMFANIYLILYTPGNYIHLLFPEPAFSTFPLNTKNLYSNDYYIKVHKIPGNNPWQELFKNEGTYELIYIVSAERLTNLEKLLKTYSEIKNMNKLNLLIEKSNEIKVEIRFLKRHFLLETNNEKVPESELMGSYRGNEQIILAKYGEWITDTDFYIKEYSF